MIAEVIIREQLARTVLVEAPDVDTAEWYVEELYQTGEIVLGAEDYVECSSEIDGVSPEELVTDYFPNIKPDYIVPKDWGKQ